MTAPAQTPSRRGLRSTWHLALVLLLLSMAGCAGPAKLARRSHEQLAQGEVRKAYATALKAVRKDPYNEAARGALAEAGAALMASELQTLRSTALVDSVAAAEVALRMAALRGEAAPYGVTLALDSLATTQEGAVRLAAARVFLRLGDEQMELGKPKAAHAHFLTARRFEPTSNEVETRLRQSYEAALDRVLVAPVSVEVRAALDREALSDQLYDALARQSDLQFTELLERGEAWQRMLSHEPGHLTREQAIRMARQAGATRLVWTRVYGDRVASHSDTYTGSLYHDVKRKRAEGGDAVGEEEVSFRAGMRDIWASVALECEICDVADGRIVASRTVERGAGLRALRCDPGFPGDPDEYRLCPSATEDEDEGRCREIRDAWSEAMGDLSVADFIKNANEEPRVIAFGRSKRYGRASHDHRAYSIYYGSPPPEAALLMNALEDVWSEAASALEESDRE